MTKNNEKKSGKSRVVVSLALVILLGVISIGVAGILFKTRPAVPHRPKPEMVVTVETQKLRKSDEPIVVNAMGTVMARDDLSLQSQVTGKVVEMNDLFQNGQVVNKGDVLLKIESSDYHSAVKRAQASFNSAKSDYALELGNQTVAKKEWEMLDPEVREKVENKSLALREPQLQASEAMLESAEASLNDALLNLERTSVKVPFNAIIDSRDVDLGAVVSSQNSLATLIGTDVFRVQVLVLPEVLKWINFPTKEGGNGSCVILHTSDGQTREGRVSSLLGSLDSAGRMARLMVEVEDPFALKPENNGQVRLLVGQYLAVEVIGDPVEDVFSIPRTAIHDGNNIWIRDADGRLEIRQVELFWKGSDQVFLKSGVEPEEEIVLSNLSMPVSGLKLSTGGKAGQAKLQN